MSSLRDRLEQSGFEKWSGKRTRGGLNSFDIVAILNVVLCVCVCVGRKGFLEYELMLMD